jgi:hypothetical protein
MLRSIHCVALAVTLAQCACRRTETPSAARSSLSVDVVPAGEAASFSKPPLVVIRDPRGRERSAAPPAVFQGLEAGSVWTVGVVGPFLSEVRSVRIVGQRDALVLHVVPLASLEELKAEAADCVPSGDAPPHRRLFVDVRGREALELVWRDGARAQRLSSQVRNQDSLGRAVAEEWNRYGTHRSPDDPARDDAWLVVDDASKFDDVVPIVRVFDEARRPFAHRVPESAPVFAVSLVHASVYEALFESKALEGGGFGFSARFTGGFVSGRMEETVVFDAIRIAIERATPCTARPAGRITTSVHFYVGADGRPSMIEVKDATVPPELASCLRASICQVRLPKLQDSILGVRADFELSP